MAPEELDLAELTVMVESARASAGPFRAHAVFDEQLDCIRVLWRDCSTNEIRVSELLTILENNYPDVAETPECVGFTIKGIAHICETCNISPDVPWKLADFLDALVKLDKPIGRYTVQRDLRPQVVAQRLEEVERPVAA